MQRIMNTKHKKGDVREDGYVFVGYRKRDNGIFEEWANPARLSRPRCEGMKTVRRPIEYRSNHKRGDKREDGLIFWNVRYTGIASHETWVTEKKYAELSDREKCLVKNIGLPLKQEIKAIITNKEILSQSKRLVANAIRMGWMKKAA